LQIIGGACAVAAGFAQTTRPPAAQPPEYVVSGFLFREVSAFKQAETNAKADGKPTPSLRSMIRNRFGFDDRQAEIYEQVALDCQREVAAIDAQARAIIQKIRSAYPGGVILPGEKPPQAPPELAALQQQRNALILQYRGTLEGRLGPAAFWLRRGLRTAARCQNSGEDAGPRGRSLHRSSVPGVGRIEVNHVEPRYTAWMFESRLFEHGRACAKRAVG
jgi:hypothetical protein